MDAMVALPSGMPRILKDQWYRMKIRCENSPAPSSFTTITIWLASGGSPFPSTPHYMQTYRGLQKGTNQGDPIIEVRDALLEPVWYRKGTVAILSCFSNISVKNLSVYRGVGSGRTEFYSLQEHGAEYMADINDFYDHWIRVGHDSAHVTDRNVWSVEQEGSEYVIRTTAADGWPIAMPWSDAYRRDDNHGVYASAYLKYKDEVDFSSFNLEDCEIEYDLRVGKRNTGYAESGMAFHFTNRTGVLDTYVDGRAPDLGNEGGVAESPEEAEMADGTVFAGSSDGQLLRFGSYFRQHYRYFAANLRPDRMEVTHHRESSAKIVNEDPPYTYAADGSNGLFYGGTPWDASFSIDPDSLAYSEGHNYDGEMAGAILRFSRYVLDTATPPDLRTHFATNASSYITAMNDNLLAKWINAAQLYTGSSDLFYGASQSNCLLGIGSLDDGHVWRYAKARTGSMLLHARGLSGITPAHSNFSDEYCDYYHTKIADAFVSKQIEGRDTWLWYDGAGWWETYDNGVIDVNHYAAEVRHVFMSDEQRLYMMGVGIHNGGENVGQQSERCRRDAQPCACCSEETITKAIGMHNHLDSCWGAVYFAVSLVVAGQIVIRHPRIRATYRGYRHELS
jgi:hypothetical protein